MPTHMAELAGFALTLFMPHKICGIVSIGRSSGAMSVRTQKLKGRSKEGTQDERFSIPLTWLAKHKMPRAVDGSTPSSLSCIILIPT